MDSGWENSSLFGGGIVEEKEESRHLSERLCCCDHGTSVSGMMVKLLLAQKDVIDCRNNHHINELYGTLCNTNTMFLVVL